MLLTFNCNEIIILQYNFTLKSWLRKPFRKKYIFVILNLLIVIIGRIRYFFYTKNSWSEFYNTKPSLCKELQNLRDIINQFSYRNKHSTFRVQQYWLSSFWSSNIFAIPFFIFSNCFLTKYHQIIKIVKMYRRLLVHFPYLKKIFFPKNVISWKCDFPKNVMP